MTWFSVGRRALFARRRGLALGAAVFALAAFALSYARAGLGGWTMDDAGITYAAAFELADHGSLAPYVGGTPVESYSNPLVFFVVASLRLLGRFDLLRTHVRIEMLLFAVMSVTLWATLRRWFGELAALLGGVSFILLSVLTPATLLWFGSGLESVWLSCGMVVLLWLCARTVDGAPLVWAWGIVIFLVSITRPEAPVYVAAFYGAVGAFARSEGTCWTVHLRRLMPAAGTTILLFAAFLVWRRVGYGDWLPNTYYAKLAGRAAWHLSDYVVAQVLPYGSAGMLAATVIVALMTPELARFATCLLVFVVASLTLPITAGADWMGEHRFAVCFLTMCHACGALFVALVASRLGKLPVRRWRAAEVGPLVFAVLLAAVIGAGHTTARERPVPNPATLSLVAELQGGERWDHQLRVGLPYAVVQMPDAGGSLLFGGMQMVDNGLLADFQMPRLFEGAGPATLAQYQLGERRADLVDPNPNFPYDQAEVARRYVNGPHKLYVRRELVEVDAIDPEARLVLDDGRVRVYLSPETVQVAGPGGLVRCEVIVAWSDDALDPAVALRGKIEEGDRDELSLAPYAPGPRGLERRALLLGAPARDGVFAVDLELVRHGAREAQATAFTLTVARDAGSLAVASLEALRAPGPGAARRLAWLREQSKPRLSSTQFHRELRALRRDDERHAMRGSQAILKLRDNARTADDQAPVVILAAERVAAQRLVDACARGPADVAGRATRAVCLGRAIDELRRLGYVDALAALPDAHAELQRVRDDYAAWPLPARYQAIVGLTLADPSSVSLQRALLAIRREVGAAGPFPPI